MSQNSTKQPVGTSRSLHDAILAALVSLITAFAAVGGFLIGRNATQDAFIKKVSTQGSVEDATLVSAGTAPLSMLQVLGKGIDDPLMTQALAAAYGVPPGDRNALVRRLRDIVVLPPYRPAPFVGHMARPVFGDDLHINVLGFRDERQTYITKPERTVRIFITGGSTAWGVGASSQKSTISYILEQLLNAQVGRATGYRYEVINAAFPAWSTTQEKLLVEQRLIDMHPDVVIMFSGNNDVHWSLQGSDVRWFYSYMDQNYVTLLNEMFKSSGHPEWTSAFPFSSRPVTCSELGRTTARNVELAAAAAAKVHARLIFALQPNIVSTAKRLTAHEQRVQEAQNKPYWESCYQALRDTLGAINAPNYRMLDLSRSFGTLDERTELFIDVYHFADPGNHAIAQALADQIDWHTIVPGSAVSAGGEALTIVKINPTEPVAEKPFTALADGMSVIRIVPSRINKNLLVVFDRSVLPTTIGNEVITASIPTSRYAAKREHTISLVDGVTGETSPPIVFQNR
jgi:lysophospholipase L1-like esterase